MVREITELPMGDESFFQFSMQIRTTYI